MRLVTSTVCFDFIFCALISFDLCSLFFFFLLNVGLHFKRKKIVKGTDNFLPGHYPLRLQIFTLIQNMSKTPVKINTENSIIWTFSIMWKLCPKEKRVKNHWCRSLILNSMSFQSMCLSCNKSSCSFSKEWSSPTTAWHHCMLSWKQALWRLGQ